MTKYSATLSTGGVVSRNSHRTYTHYWRAWGRDEANGFSGGDGGFAGSAELATRAVASTISRLRKSGGHNAQFHSEIVEAKAEAA